MKARKVFVSGIKPTGRPHLGNYFGAMRQIVDLEKTHDGFFFLANYHALTSLPLKTELEENTIEMAIDYLALGLDPNKTTIFFQSDVPEVTELSWVFGNLLSVPYLSRAHAFKDAEAKNKDVNIGLFTYPVLMAADILTYGADIVPVGQDQKQHIEIARDVALKFNNTYGETLTAPEPFILETVKTVPGTDGQKMSKSYNNTIPLFGTDEELKAAVFSIVTDSKGAGEAKDPNVCNVFKLHELFMNQEELYALSDEYKKGMSYKDSKELLLSRIKTFFGPMRERREELAKDRDQVMQILKNGGERAREVARAKVKVVKERVGLL